MEQGTLGKRIAYHRKRLGMTQEQLAQRVGVSAQAVSKWENNLSCPDITILPELASIFGISVDELLGRTPPKEERVHEAEVIKPEEKEHILDYTIGSAARSGLWFAIYVLAIGALFLVNALGKFDVSVWTILWTSALLLGGLSMLTHRFSCFSIGLMLVGGYSLLTAFGFLSIGFRWSVLIPVFLLLWGVSLLVDYFCGRRRKQHHVRASYGGKFTQDTRCDNGHLSCELSFGSCRVPVVTPLLRSGRIETSFGDFTVDLSGCEAVQDNCPLTVETVVLLSHKKPDGHINVKVEFSKGEGKVPLDNITKRAEGYKPKERVTYKMIKEYIEAKYGFKVHTAYIAEVKRELGLPMYDAPNAAEGLKQTRKHPTQEKVNAIKDALNYYNLI